MCLSVQIKKCKFFNGKWELRFFLTPFLKIEVIQVVDDLKGKILYKPNNVVVGSG
jgi:hypothetical protein